MQIPDRFTIEQLLCMIFFYTEHYFLLIQILVTTEITMKLELEYLNTSYIDW